MKKYIYPLFLIAIIINGVSAFAEKPILAVTSIKGNSARTKNISRFVINHLNNLFSISDIFDLVKQGQIDKELEKYGCVDPECLNNFSRKAGVSVVVTGELREQGKGITLTLKGFSFKAPYSGNLMYKYEAVIPLSEKKFSMGDFSYIAEEHSGRFISGFFKNYYQPVYPVVSENKEPLFDIDNGTYELYEIIRLAGQPPIIKKSDRVEIKNKKIVNGRREQVVPGSFFVLKGFKKESRFFKEFFIGRKSEIVFNSSNYSDLVYTMFFTPLLSALSPAIAPLGYYEAGDYKGMGLWAVNYAPYGYISYQGLTNKPKDLEADRKNISRKNYADYYFGLYHTFAGGMALYADAFSTNAIKEAANYGKKEQYFGNKYVSVYLSMISGGGGHFYKGYRGWGYFYYHMNNILVYSTIYNLSKDRTYSRSQGKYIDGEINKKKGYILAGVTAAVKLVEIIHGAMLPENILNGHVTEDNQGFSISGYIGDDDTNIMVGYYYRF